MCSNEENCACDCEGKKPCCLKNQPSTLFMENVSDIAFTLSDIMIICGIHECKARGTCKVIINTFLYYDEIRHHISSKPWKRLCKGDLLRDLGEKALMTGLEAQLAYYLIKQSFKAFYHGTIARGIRNPIVEAEIILTQGSAWHHAACRTIQIFKAYEDIFTKSKLDYPTKIKCLYKVLFERLRNRAEAQRVSHRCRCHCNTAKYTMNGTDEQTQKEYVTCIPAAPTTKSHLNMVCCKNETTVEAKGRTWSKVSILLPRCLKCNAPELLCDCSVDPNTGIVSPDYGQDSYKCQWVRSDDSDEPAKTGKPVDPCNADMEGHECPVDCDDRSIQSCGSESICSSVECDECLCEDIGDQQNTSETESLECTTYTTKDQNNNKRFNYEFIKLSKCVPTASPQAQCSCSQDRNCKQGKREVKLVKKPTRSKTNSQRKKKPGKQIKQKEEKKEVKQISFAI